MAKKKTKTIVTTTDEDVQNNGSPPEGSADGGSDNAEDQQQIQFSSLFDLDSDHSEVRVMLRRISPKGTMHDHVTGTEVPIAGYLEDLPPGLGSYEGYVRERYGGGIYLATRMVKKSSGKWLFGANRQIEIGGIPPKVASPFPTFGAGGQQTNAGLAGDPTGGAVVTVNGVQVPLAMDFSQLEQVMLKVKAIQAIFPEPPLQPDINVALIEMLSRRDTADPSHMIESIGAIIGAVKEFVGDGGGGGIDIMSLANNALTTLQKLADKSKPAPTPGQVAVPVKPVAQLPANTETETNSHIEAEETVELNTQQIAQTAIANIISGFRLDPPMEVDDLVQALDDVLPLEREVLAQLPAFKKKLWNLTRLSLSEHFAEIPDSQDQFETYFNQVFDRFVDLEREIVTLGG